MSGRTYKAIVKVENYENTVTIENVHDCPSYFEILDAVKDITGHTVDSHINIDSSAWGDGYGSMIITFVLNDDGELNGNNVVNATVELQ